MLMITKGSHNDINVLLCLFLMYEMSPAI